MWDRGPGIPEDKLKVIFEEFKRLDSHQTRAEKGLGLGLAIASRAVEMHGGSIKASNLPGGGLSVAITLPL